MKGGAKKLVVFQGILIILLIGAVWYVYTRPSEEKNENTNNQGSTKVSNTSTPPPSPQAATDITKNWKTYEDDYGFSFLYPPDYKFNFEYPGEFGENYPLKVITLIPPSQTATEISFTIIGGTLERNTNDELGGMCTSEETTLGKNKIPIIQRTCSGSVVHSIAYKMQLKQNTIMTLEVSGGRDPSREISSSIVDALVNSITVEK